MNSSVFLHPETVDVFQLCADIWLLDGECDHAEMVMIVAMGLSYLKDSSEEYEPTKSELICFTENVYFLILIRPSLTFLIMSIIFRMEMQ